MLGGVAAGQWSCTGFHLQVLYRTAPLRYIHLVKTNLLATATRPSESTCFRLYLQAELGRRIAKNPQYSLRAFAKYLAIDRILVPPIRAMLHQPVIGDPGEHAAVKESFRPCRVEVAGGLGGDNLVGGLAGVD